MMIFVMIMMKYSDEGDDGHTKSFVMVVMIKMVMTIKTNKKCYHLTP